MKSMFIRLGLLALFMTALSGCSGSDGAAGPAGPAGQNGTNGINGIDGTNGTNGTSPGTNAATMTPTQWASSQFTGQITGVTINASGKPVVSFKVADAGGNPVTGLGNKAASTTSVGYTYPNLAFVIAKLIPGTNGSPSVWRSYVVTNVPSVAAAPAPSKPTTDNTGTLVDNNDGTYQYTFYRRIDGGASSVQEAVTNSTDSTATACTTTATCNLKADLGDITYQPTLTHRVGIMIMGNARGTGTNTANGVQVTPAVALKTPVNLFYDFVPATGAAVADTETDPAKQRNVVNVANCFTCHDKFAGIHGGSVLTGVGGSRQDTKMCVMCHTAQAAFGRPESTMTATSVIPNPNQVNANTGVVDYSTYVYTIGGERKALVEFPNWIHKIHMGEDLIKTGYNVGNSSTNPTGGVNPNEVRFPQDQRNCVKCHSNAAQAASYKVPNRLACGGCHDGIDFSAQGGAGIRINDKKLDLANGNPVGTTHTGHGGGQMLNDSGCPICHGAGNGQDIAVMHTPNTLNISPLSPNVATPSPFFMAYADNVPNGTTRITYDLKTVALNASRNPVFTFRFLSSTATRASNTVTWSTPVPVTFQTVTGTTTELLPNFVGTGPSVYMVGSVPQDGITPADWNLSINTIVRSCWNGTPPAANNPGGTCTMVASSTAGYYDLTITGSVVPTNAVRLTGWLGLNGPMIQTDVPGYLYTAGPPATGGVNFPAIAVSKPVVSTDTRRAIVERARCEKCHNQLGVFTNAQFHNGQRNDPTACNVCHNMNRTSGGWAVNSSSYIHGIHAAAKRAEAGGRPFTWVSSAYGRNDIWATLGYPGLLRDCQQCHLPNTVNFGNPANAAAAYGGTATNTTVGTLPFMGTATGRFVTAVSGVATTYTGTTGTCVAGTTSPSAAGATALNIGVISPWVKAYGNDVSFGAGWVGNFTTAVSPAAPAVSCTPDGVAYTLAAGTTREADGNTLVNSPIATACFSCHTTDAAMSHMRGNGGALYATRASLRTDPANPTRLVNSEACLVCHGAGRVADVEVIHAQTMK